MKFPQLPRLATFALATLLPLSANAATSNATSSSYLVMHSVDVAASASAVYAAIGQLDKWWDARHTYSGKSENLKLDMKAGGCFCEVWDGNSVEHMHVLYALRDQGVRMQGGLGPLQEKAALGILTFTLTPVAGKTRILLTYRVRAPEGGLNASAGLVDAVVGDQLTGLVKYLGQK